MTRRDIVIVVLLLLSAAPLRSQTPHHQFSSAQWKPKDLSSGVYFCRLQGNGFVETKKLVLVR